MNATSWQKCISKLIANAAATADQIHVLTSFVNCIQDWTFVEQIVVIALALIETNWVHLLHWRSIWASWKADRLIPFIVTIECERTISLLLLFLLVVVTFVVIAIAEFMWWVIKSIAFQIRGHFVCMIVSRWSRINGMSVEWIVAVNMKEWNLRGLNLLIIIVFDFLLFDCHTFCLLRALRIIVGNFVFVKVLGTFALRP